MLIRGSATRPQIAREEMGLNLLGIGAHLGRAVAQNAQGDVLGHVRDFRSRLIQGHACARPSDGIFAVLP